MTLLNVCSADQTTLETAVAEPSQKPIWNATLLFSGVDGESLMKRSIEVTLWDLCPNVEPVFLGECTVDLKRALENDRAVWCVCSEVLLMTSAFPLYSIIARNKVS